MHDITVTSIINKFHVFTSIYVITRESNSLYEEIPQSVLMMQLLLTEWDNHYLKIFKLLCNKTEILMSRRDAMTTCNIMVPGIKNSGFEVRYREINIQFAS